MTKRLRRNVTYHRTVVFLLVFLIIELGLLLHEVHAL